MSDGNQVQFNRYCAEVVGIKIQQCNMAAPLFYIGDTAEVYDPYNDLTQLIEAVDQIRKKYLWSCVKVGEHEKLIECVNSAWFVVYRSTLSGSPLKDALHKFIWSVMATDKLSNAGCIVTSQ